MYSKKVTELVSKMTLDEKFSMLGGQNKLYTVPVKRLGIPSIKMADASVGLRHEGGDCKLNIAYPASISLAATWNKKLARQAGKALALDCKANDPRAQILLGPGVNIHWIPNCGRNAEYMGEDPHLAGMIAAEFVKGLQNENIPATVKHMAANNQEFDRFYMSSDVDERTLREIYLRAFEIVVKKANVAGVMMGCNPLNGEYTSQHDFLINQVLKKQWKFKGIVMSDWGVVHDGITAVLSGLDLEMPFTQHMTKENLNELIEKQCIDIKIIDDKVARVLSLIERFGYFDKKNLKPDKTIDTKKNRKMALEIARQGCVLLKNKGNILPFNTSKIKSLAVLGPNAHPTPTGCGGSSRVQPERKISVLDGILDRAGKDIDITWQDRCTYKNCEPTAIESLKKERSTFEENAKKIAKSHDAVVICVGFNVGDKVESEDVDRPYGLNRYDVRLIWEVSQINPNTVVLVNAGGNANLGQFADKVPAIMHIWYPGQEGGTAIAELLFGDVNPSGRLPISIEKKWEDHHAFDSYTFDFAYQNEAKKLRYKEGIFVGYRHYETRGIDVLFPFGHGLSYTSFKYKNLKVKKNAKMKYEVSFDISNTGKMTGSEVPQLYIGDIECTCNRPAKELKAFEKITLKPGESKNVKFKIDRAAFEFFDPIEKEWIVEPGQFKIMVGSSCRDIHLTKIIKI